MIQSTILVKHDAEVDFSGEGAKASKASKFAEKLHMLPTKVLEHVFKLIIYKIRGTISAPKKTTMNSFISRFSFLLLPVLFLPNLLLPNLCKDCLCS